MPRPPPPATALTITGKPTLLAHFCASSTSFITPSDPGRMGTPLFFIVARALVLFAHSANDFRRRSDEFEPAGLTHVCEICILAQQSVAGVDGIGIGDFGGADNRRDIEIAFRGRGGPMQIASSAKRTWSELRSASLYTATALMPSSLAAQIHAERDFAAIGN